MTKEKAAALLAQNLDAVHGYCFSRLFDKAQTEDLANEIVCDVLTHAEKIRNDAAFWGFVWRIADRTFKRFIRKQDLHGRYAEQTNSFAIGFVQSPEQEYVELEEQKETLFCLRRELSLLTKLQREITVAYYFDHKSCSQIAQEQEMSVENVKYHLFKTRKLLKEGIEMSRSLGEKSYNPGVFRLAFWGDHNYYAELFRRKLPGAILLAAYDRPMKAEELSLELGVAMPYLEEELDILETSAVLQHDKTGYRTNILIVKDQYEKEVELKTQDLYETVAARIFEQIESVLAHIIKQPFDAVGYDRNAMLFCLMNVVLNRAWFAADEESPISPYQALPMGGHGWIFGYDNDFLHHRFNGVSLETVKSENTVWFNVFNYKAIAKQQQYDYLSFSGNASAMWDAILQKKADHDNPVLPILIENRFIACKNDRLCALFPVFEKQEFANLCNILSDAIVSAADCMIRVSDIAEPILKQYAPKTLWAQCADIAKINHRLNTAAYLTEELLKKGKLLLPTEKAPLGVFAVKK